MDDLHREKWRFILNLLVSVESTKKGRERASSGVGWTDRFLYGTVAWRSE